MKKAISIAIVVLLVAASTAVFATTYVWRDANGTMHITDTKPPEDAKLIKTIEGGPAPPPPTEEGEEFAPTGGTLVLRDLLVERDDWQVRLSAKILNDTGVPVEGIQVNTASYDQFGTESSTDTFYPKPSSLQPGDEARVIKIITDREKQVMNVAITNVQFNTVGAPPDQEIPPVSLPELLPVPAESTGFRPLDSSVPPPPQPTPTPT